MEKPKSLTKEQKLLNQHKKDRKGKFSVEGDPNDFSFEEASPYTYFLPSGRVFNLFMLIRTLINENYERITNDGYFVIDFGPRDLASDAEISRFLKRDIENANYYKWNVGHGGILDCDPSLTKNITGSIEEALPRSFDATFKWSKEAISNFFKKLPTSDAIYKLDKTCPVMDQILGRFNLNAFFDPLNFYKIITKKVIEGVNSTWTYVSSAFTAASMHCEDGNVSSANVCLEGGNKLWFVINPVNTLRLREALACWYGGGCFATMNSKRFLVPPHILKKWNIPYQTYVQQKNQLIITIGSASHQVLNAHYSLNDSINFICEETDRRATKNKDEYECHCYQNYKSKKKAEFLQRLQMQPSLAHHGQNCLIDVNFEEIVQKCNYSNSIDPMVQQYNNGIIPEAPSDGTKNLPSVQLPTAQKSKAFQCKEDGCKKAYASKDNLKRHTKATHLGLTFQCAECKGYKYSDRQGLRNHNRTHHSKTQ